MADNIIIRTAQETDADKIREIYAPYTENTAITFEYEVPSVEEFRGRMREIKEKYPYLVAEIDGEIVGYAYAGVFKNRAAYDWAVEVTVYVSENKKQNGIGSRLYGVLEEILKKQGILNLNACIAYAENEDEYLTKDSVRFHENQGYEIVGHFHKCGCKFNRWYDMVWMEKIIGAHTDIPPEIKPFSNKFTKQSQ